MPQARIMNASSAYELPFRFSSPSIHHFVSPPSRTPSQHVSQPASSDVPALPATLRSPSTSEEVAHRTVLEKAGRHTVGSVVEVSRIVLAADHRTAVVVAARIAAGLHTRPAVRRTVVQVERRNLAVDRRVVEAGRIAEAGHIVGVEERHSRQRHLEELQSQDDSF